MNLSKQFSQALHFANSMHGNQLRKGGQVPYMAHLLSVAALVLEHGGSENEAWAIFLDS